jgi:hypothetical protein
MAGEPPLFRWATGYCLKPVTQRATAGRIARASPAMSISSIAATGAEGPGMAVELGWSKDPNAKWQWPGGPVTGIIAPDRSTGSAWSRPPLPKGSSRARFRRWTHSNNHRCTRSMVPVRRNRGDHLRPRAPARNRKAGRSDWTSLETLVAEPWDDWGLIDCGNGQKLERYGPVTVARPEPQAMWAPASERLGPGCDLRSRIRRRRRRPLGPAPPMFRSAGRWRAARCASTPR